MSERAVQVDPSNADQFQAWDGDQGSFWAARATRLDEGVAAYHEHFLSAAGIDPQANVLDIGCGSGTTTRAAARRAAEGTAVGVDLSGSMIELARELAQREQISNVRFEQADVQLHPFPAQHFDVGMSRNGAMFFGDASAAFANIARALCADARLVLLAWQPLDRNEFLSAFRTCLGAGREIPVPSHSPEQPGPFSLSDPDSVRRLLTSAGFADVRLRGIEEPMYFGRDADDAFQFVSAQFAGMLEGLDEAGKKRALGDLRRNLADHETERGVLYGSAAWLIEARRG